MKILARTFLAATIAAGAFAASQSQAALNQPDMYVVVFRADWCAPCRVLEPKLKMAIQRLNDSKIEYVEIDISNPGLSEIGAHRAFDREIVSQYNKWLGVTGFAVMIDADTKQTLGCVNRSYDEGSMQMHIRNLKTYALANTSTFDVTCPPANN